MTNRILIAALLVALLPASARFASAQGAGPSNLGPGTPAPAPFSTLLGWDPNSKVVPAGFFSGLSGRNSGQPTPATSVSVVQEPAHIEMPGDIIIPDTGPPVMAGGESCGDCCIPARASRPCFWVFGEVLYLNPQNVEVPYAVQFNGPVTGTPPAVPVQTSQIFLTDPDYTPGYRAGAGFAIGCDSSISATFTYFDATSDSAYTIENPSTEKLLRNLASHPLVFNANTDSLSASASYQLIYELADVDFRTLVVCGDRFMVNLVLGARYANLDQDFTTTHTEQISDTVDTNITFSGAGPRVGLEFEKQNSCRGLFVYCRSYASFASGDFHATFNQSQTTQPDLVNTSWDAGRVVSMLDLEVGAGWQGPCRRLRISGGYMLSSWYNVVKSDDWIRAVQTNYYGDLGSNITFDGLTARAEIRW